MKSEENTHPVGLSGLGRWMMDRRGGSRGKAQELEAALDEQFIGGGREHEGIVAAHLHLGLRASRVGGTLHFGTRASGAVPWKINDSPPAQMAGVVASERRHGWAWGRSIKPSLSEWRAGKPLGARRRYGTGRETCAPLHVPGRGNA